MIIPTKDTTLSRETPVVILAGGHGARMGGYKPFHPCDETTLVEATLARLRPQTALIYLNAGVEGTSLAHALMGLQLPVIFDAPSSAELGPLSGVLSALTLARRRGVNAVITAPCDMPHLPMTMVSQLLDVDLTHSDIVFFEGLRTYPLCALWKTSVKSDLEAALKDAQPKGGMAVMRFLQSQRVHTIKVTDDGAFININTPNIETERPS